MNRWKEASSVIISAAYKNHISHKKLISKLSEVEQSNYEILALKKKNVISGKPHICVFPGGSVSPADSVQEWEKLFSAFGLSMNILSNSLFNLSVSKLPIFYSQKKGIPRWLSLRITAIRETFEECGILLCTDKQLTPKLTKDTSSCTTNHFEIENIELWRNRVLDDPYQFISLCKLCNCYPDVENLFLWSNWLTPSHLHERFDAVFFFTNVNTLALYKASPDYKEIISTEWIQPEELLKLSDRSEIWLKPPQWYEIKTLLNVQESSDLHKYSYKRSRNCVRWMPVRVVTVDGEISLLPGDEMYPSELNLFNPSPMVRDQETMVSLRCRRMHRMEHTGVKTLLLDTRHL